MGFFEMSLAMYIYLRQGQGSVPIRYVCSHVEHGCIPDRDIFHDPIGVLEKGAKQNVTPATGRCIDYTGNFTCLIRPLRVSRDWRMALVIRHSGCKRATRLQVSLFLNFYFTFLKFNFLRVSKCRCFLFGGGGKPLGRRHQKRVLIY